MRTFLRTLSLAVASAVTAEFLLGDQYLSGIAPIQQQVAELVLFTAFYGSAAVLIRELARRARVGWPGILALALAFGIIEEGIVDQSLFNPNYAGAHLIAYGFIPWLGTAGPWMIFVLTLHVVWSIGSPIAIMEGAFGSQPWVKRVGWLAVPAVLYVLGGTAIFVVSLKAGGFMATPAELVVSAVVAVALVVAVFTVLRGRGATPAGERRGAGYTVSAVVALVLAGAFQLTSNLPHSVSPWVPALVGLALLAAGIVFAFLTRPDALGFGSGAIVVYCLVGMQHAIQAGPVAIVEQLVLVLIALGVLTLVAVRRRGRRSLVAA